MEPSNSLWAVPLFVTCLTGDALPAPTTGIVPVSLVILVRPGGWVMVEAQAHRDLEAMPVPL